MEFQPTTILKLPFAALRFAGKQLLGGGWSELPPLPQGEIKRPVRASIQYYRSPDHQPTTGSNANTDLQ